MQLARPLHTAERAARADNAVSEHVWVLQPRGTGLASHLRELWTSRHLFRYFFIETVKRRYRRTLIGWPWLIIRPLAPVVLSTFVFSGLAGIESGETPYFLFVLVGMAVWQLFQEGLMWTTRSLQMYRSLLRKLYFPRLILPFSATGPAVFDFLIIVGLVIGFGTYYSLADAKAYLILGPGLLFSLAAVVLSFTLAVSIGLFTSVLGAEMRDIRFTLPIVFQFWFFLTPVAYPASLVPEQWRWLLIVNPMYTAVELFKVGVLGISTQLRPEQVAGTVVMIAMVMTSGLWFFIKAEAASIDRL